MEYIYTRFIIPAESIQDVREWAEDLNNQTQLQLHRLGEQDTWQVCIHDISSPSSHQTEKHLEFSRKFGLEAQG